MIEEKKEKILVNPRGTIFNIGITSLESDIFSNPIFLAISAINFS